MSSPLQGRRPFVFRELLHGTGYWHPNDNPAGVLGIPEQAEARCADGKVRRVNLAHMPEESRWPGVCTWRWQSVEGYVYQESDPRSPYHLELCFMAYPEPNPYRQMYDYDADSKTLTLKAEYLEKHPSPIYRPRMLPA